MGLGSDISGGISAGSGAVTRGMIAGSQDASTQLAIHKQKQQEFMQQLQMNVKSQADLYNSLKQKLDFQTGQSLNNVKKNIVPEKQVQATQAIEDKYKQQLDLIKQQAAQTVLHQYAPLVNAGSKMGYVDPSMLETIQNTMTAGLNTLRPDQQDILASEKMQATTQGQTMGQGGVNTFKMPGGAYKSAMKGDTTRNQKLIQEGGYVEPKSTGSQLYYNEPPNDWEKRALGVLSSYGQKLTKQQSYFAKEGLDEIRSLNPDMKPEDAAMVYIGNVGHGKQYLLSKAAWAEGGKMSTWATSVNRLTKHSDLLIDAANKLDPNKNETVNKLANMWSNWTGDPRINNFETLKIAVANEYSKMLKGAGAMGDAEVERTLKPLKATGSLPKLIQAIQNMKHIMAEQVSQSYQSYYLPREGIDKNIAQRFARHFSGEVMQNVKLPDMGQAPSNVQETGQQTNQQNNQQTNPQQNNQLQTVINGQSYNHPPNTTLMIDPANPTVYVAIPNQNVEKAKSGGWQIP